MCILVEHLDVEVGVWGHEVEHVTFPHVGPVFPSYVPSFYEHLVETVLGSEVDVTLHLLVVGSMTTVGLHAAPVYLVEFYRGKLVGVVPTALAYNHLPPYTAVFRGVYPRGVVKSARLVEVQYEVA